MRGPSGQDAIFASLVASTPLGTMCSAIMRFLSDGRRSETLSVCPPRALSPAHGWHGSGLLARRDERMERAVENRAAKVLSCTAKTAFWDPTPAKHWSSATLDGNIKYKKKKKKKRYWPRPTIIAPHNATNKQRMWMTAWAPAARNIGSESYT